jgi:hypothetical protein
LKGYLATAEVKNGNGRYYPKELWEREISKYQDVIKENRATGELDHPDLQLLTLKMYLILLEIYGGMEIK